MSASGELMIWEKADLNLATTTVCVFRIEHIEKIDAFRAAVAHVETVTGARVHTYGLDGRRELIWMQIKGTPTERNSAYDLIKAKSACFKVPLPETIQRSKSLGLRNIDENGEFVDDDNDVKENENVESSDMFDSNARLHHQQQPHQQAYSAKHATRMLTRSSTDSFLSGSSRDNLTSPFANVLAPLPLTGGSDSYSSSSNNNSSQSKLLPNAALSVPSSMVVADVVSAGTVPAAAPNAVTAVANGDGSKRRRVYTINFLLGRSEANTSRRMPDNWKELNAKYPDICLVGRVLSYFDPFKYHAHWRKVQNLNPLLHNTTGDTLSLSTAPASTPAPTVAAEVTTETPNMATNGFYQRNTNGRSDYCHFNTRNSQMLPSASLSSSLATNRENKGGGGVAFTTAVAADGRIYRVWNGEPPTKSAVNNNLFYNHINNSNATRSFNDGNNTGGVRYQPNNNYYDGRYGRQQQQQQQHHEYAGPEPYKCGQYYDSQLRQKYHTTNGRSVVGYNSNSNGSSSSNSTSTSSNDFTRMEPVWQRSSKIAD